ncbi:GntR family transcriptional regulator [Frankia sp. Cj3]|uniref:GntR family transcriptional regulator n=1 Tax=Frankia sp. Cj3 TaxID=2880976 RepID=UPI001EF57BD8|nr:GntR family transcriptional regulator [Frankia sp. Cj3]
MARESQSDQIANELRERIKSGSLGPGALVPSEPELARAHDVSRATARAALQVLEQEGLVIVRPKRGRIVRGFSRLVWRLSEFELPENTGLVSSDAWEADIERQGHDPTRQDLQVEMVQPPPRIAEILDLHPDADRCVVRRHLRYIDGEPGIISDDYFDEAIVRGTELAAPEDTTREDILKETGYEQTYDVDEIITRMPTAAEVARLSISANQPVAEHTRVGYTAAGKAVRVMVSIVPGSVLVLRYVVPT